jgi:predicted secreted hydrolase
MTTPEDKRSPASVRRVLRWPLIGLGMVVALVLVLVLAGVLFRVTAGQVSPEKEINLPDPNNRLKTPRDFAGHPAHLIEWRRVGGWLKDQSGRPIAFSLDVLRNDLPAWSQILRRSPLQSRRKFFMSLMIADETFGKVLTQEKSGEIEPPPAEAQRVDLVLADWRMSIAPLEVSLAVKADTYRLALRGMPEKKAVLYGVGGYHWRSTDGAPTYFLGFPRLAFEGDYSRGEGLVSVRGTGYLAHEFTSYELPPQTIGWDRLTLVLDNLHELTVIRLRRADGGVNPDSPLALVLPDGDVVAAAAGSYELKPTQFWQSEKTGANYPIAWSLRMPQYRADLEITAPIAEMEIVRRAGQDIGWLGPLAVEGQWGEWKIRGQGFGELTGYRGAKSFF